MASFVNARLPTADEETAAPIALDPASRRVTDLVTSSLERAGGDGNSAFLSFSHRDDGSTIAVVRA